MDYKINNSFNKVCALVAATLILPVLAFAKHDNGKDNDGKGDNDRGEKQVPVVPEANAAWVLVPFFGAVLLFSARQLFRAKA
jgi:hypothetical protein